MVRRAAIAHYHLMCSELSRFPDALLFEAYLGLAEWHVQHQRVSDAQGCCGSTRSTGRSTWRLGAPAALSSPSSPPSPTTSVSHVPYIVSQA